MAKRIKTIISGRVFEQYEYSYVTGFTPQKVRRGRQGVTDTAKAKINKDNRVKHFERILNANFKRGDTHMVLTYSELPPNIAEAKKVLRKYIEKLRGWCRKREIELKYIGVTENKHGEGRIHHHMVVNIPLIYIDDMRELWHRWGDIPAEYDAKNEGEESDFFIGLSALDGSGDYAHLARYMMKERIDADDEFVGTKRYMRSQNLKTPTVITAVVGDNAVSELPIGAESVEVVSFANAYGSFCYTRAILPRDDYKPRRRVRGKHTRRCARG